MRNTIDFLIPVFSQQFFHCPRDRVGNLMKYDDLPNAAQQTRCNTRGSENCKLLEDCGLLLASVIQ